MIEFEIDGRRIGAKEGETILKAARRIGVDIPALCYHDALSPYGACRLCSVEVEHRGRRRVVASCLYPVSPGLKVFTNTENIRRLRKGIIELLLARSPSAEIIQKFAKEYGIKEPRFPKENETCILCGLCTRVCAEISKANAISLVNSGVKREVAPAFYEISDACIGCGGCAYVCPTHAIKIEDGYIKMGNTVFGKLKEVIPEGETRTVKEILEGK